MVISQQQALHMPGASKLCHEQDSYATNKKAMQQTQKLSNKLLAWSNMKAMQGAYCAVEHDSYATSCAHSVNKEAMERHTR